MNLKTYNMDKFSYRLTVIVLAFVLIIQTVFLIYDWQDLSTNGATGRSLLLILNGSILAIVGTLKNEL